MSESESGKKWTIDLGRIPADLKPALEQHDYVDPNDVTIFKNVLREYWAKAAAAVGPGANEAVIAAREELDAVRELARSRGVDVDHIEADFRTTELGLDH